ncbi:unnamed protein product, partial [Nesidiocoris tenuis]
MGHCILAVFVLLVAACGFGKSFPLAEEVPRDSNGTITDETLRKLLGMIGEFVEPVQAIPDYGYSSNSSDSRTPRIANDTSEYVRRGANLHLGLRFSIYFTGATMH